MKQLNKEPSTEELHGINNGDNLNDDNEYEPSPDTEKYKEWELKERFLNEMVELNKEVGDRDRYIDDTPPLCQRGCREFESRLSLSFLNSRV